MEKEGRIAGHIENSPMEEEPEQSLPYDVAQLRELTVQELEPAEDTAVELQAYGDFKGYLQDDPRELKRLLNVHRLVKILIQLNQPGMVWTQAMQRKLVKWLIFCSRWPELIDDVLDKGQASNGDADCLALVADDLHHNNDERHAQVAAFGDCKDRNDIMVADELRPIGDFCIAPICLI